jgi:capsular polysaccharide biosynthesis protein
MTEQEILGVIRRRWYWALLPAAIVTVLVLPDLLARNTAASGGYQTTFRYTAAQQLILPDRDGDYQDVWLASELAVNALTDWVRTTSFRDAITSESGVVDADIAPLAIAADNARSIGYVTMSHPDGEPLLRLADAAVQVLQTSTQDYFPQLGGEPAMVTILDAPVVAGVPASLPNRFEPLIRIALGLLAGVLVAFAIEYFDDRVYLEVDLTKSGLPNLASIPRARGGFPGARGR